MAHFPMFVSIDKKKCLVVGGGTVGYRKCRVLLDFGADVTVVSEKFEQQFGHNFQKGEETFRKVEKAFQMEDLEKEAWFLVVAATNDRCINSSISAYCKIHQIPVNVVDCKEECSFFFPAYSKCENVVAGISTSGESPAKAAKIRKYLEKELPGWIAQSREEEFECQKES